MKSIWISGASGLLGRSLTQVLDLKQIKWLGFSHKRIGKNLLQWDLTDPNSSLHILEQEILNSGLPQFFIHTAAERKPDVSEKNPLYTTQLNVKGTEMLALWCQKHKIPFLYISSDYIFDGTEAPYLPSALGHPLNHYGQSKWEGELIVKSNCEQFLILRIPILYGPSETLNECIVTQIFKQLQNTQQQTLDDWAIRYPTYTPDLALAILQFIEAFILSKIPSKKILHYSHQEAYTRYTMGKIVAEIANLNVSLIPIKTPTVGAPRPRDAHLDTTESELYLSFKPNTFRQGVQDVLQPFIALS